MNNFVAASVLDFSLAVIPAFAQTQLDVQATRYPRCDPADAQAEPGSDMVAWPVRVRAQPGRATSAVSAASCRSGCSPSEKRTRNRLSPSCVGLAS